MSPRVILLQKQRAEWTACLNHGSLTALAFAYRLCPLFSSFALRNLKHLFSNAKRTPMISSHSFQNTGTVQRFPAPWAQTQWRAPASEDLAGSQDGAGSQSITDRVLQHTQNPPGKPKGIHYRDHDRHVGFHTRASRLYLHRTTKPGISSVLFLKAFAISRLP